MSISSLQTTMSALSGLAMGGGVGQQNRSGGGMGGWWAGKRVDVASEIKYIYSALTKIPSLRIGPPPLKLIEGFEDCPGEMSVPLDAFKNVQLLEFDEADPRAFIGWDRLSQQLRSLSIKRSGVEDITDIIIDAVINDGLQRRGERVHHRKRKVHAPDAEGEIGPAAASNSGSATNLGETQSISLQGPLPSLAWHFLRHLSLSDNSLTFLHPSCLSCLTSLTSLDLSNNLLNAVPPSLNLLPQLESLNLTNNLIDSVMGIPTSLPGIKSLNLSQNRLESLCGLERLPTLMRIDLRKNEIFESGEVGRLATLPRIVEVYIAGNPLFEDLDDARVHVFAEFAKEGKNLDRFTLDNEPIGYFERQRVRERIPNMDHLADRGRDKTPSVDEAFSRSGDGGAESARDAVAGRSAAARLGPASAAQAPSNDSEPVIKTVRHRNHHSTTLPKANAARRNRRIVELVPETHGGNDEPERAKEEPEVSDSDAIKRAALAGDTDAALGVPRQSGSTTQRPTSPPSTLTKKSIAAMATLSTEWKEPTASATPSHVRVRSHDNPVSNNTPNAALEEQPAATSQVVRPRARVGRSKVGDSKVTMSLYDAGSSGEKPLQGDSDLRRKIEVLKGEVGDDWLRLLARGESVYVPNESEDTSGDDNEGNGGDGEGDEGGDGK